ncbi:hypothetical protein U1Q18_031871 [Sarracenia purpurea var. burkii]
MAAKHVFLARGDEKPALFKGIATVAGVLKLQATDSAENQRGLQAVIKAKEAQRVSVSDGKLEADRRKRRRCRLEVVLVAAAIRTTSDEGTTAGLIFQQNTLIIMQRLISDDRRSGNRRLTHALFTED